MTNKPRAPGQTVFSVAFQLADCCNVVGVFSTRAKALAEIRDHAMAHILLSGAGEYPNTAMLLFRKIVDNPSAFQLVERSTSFQAEETWIDLDYREPQADGKTHFQSAMFTIMRHRLDVRPISFVEDDTVSKMAFIHAAPKTVQ